MKKVIFVILVVVLVLAIAIPVFADHDTPNGPPPCDLGAPYGTERIPGQGVKGNIENMTGPDGENPGHNHMDPQWGYDGGPGNANVTCWFYPDP
jgi:hypothetical protein